MDDVRESSVGGNASLTVDTEKGIIRDVLLLREHGNDDYPRPVRESAIPLLEGKRVYVDHAPIGVVNPERSYRDSLGVLRGVYERGDGLFAREFLYNPEHPMASQVAWDAQNCPESFGFSIFGRAQKRRAGNRKVVESWGHISSCDLVTTPGHGGGIRESKGKAVAKKVSVLIEELRESRPGWSKGLREAADSGVLSPDAMMDEPEATASPSESADHETALKQGFRAAIIAALDDDSLDMKAKLKKIKEILKAEEKMLGNGSSDGDSSASDDAATEESRKQKDANVRETERLKLQIKARDLMAEKNVKADKVLLKALDGCTTEQEVREILDERAKSPPGARSSTPTREQQATSQTREQKNTPADPDKARAERLAQKRMMR